MEHKAKIQIGDDMFEVSMIVPEGVTEINTELLKMQLAQTIIQRYSNDIEYTTNINKLTEEVMRIKFTKYSNYPSIKYQHLWEAGWRVSLVKLFGFKFLKWTK